MNAPYYQVSRDAADRLREFTDEFRGALVLADSEPWAETLGLSRTTDALKTTFPIPLDAAGYKEFKGDIKFRTLYERSLSMIGKRWEDGVEVFADEIEGQDFIDWAGQPAKMAKEWARLPNEIVAAILAVSSLDGPLLDFYRDSDSNMASTRRLFASDHPFNVLMPELGDFDNTMITTEAKIASGEFYDDLDNKFAEVMGPNGKPMNLICDKLLVPRTRRSLIKNSLEFDTIVRAVTNIAGSENVAAVTQNNVYKGTIGYTIAHELADQDHLYAIASNGPPIWVVQKQGAPEEIMHDKSSELYKRQLKVGVAYIGKMNAAAALPHSIVRVEIV